MSRGARQAMCLVVRSEWFVSGFRLSGTSSIGLSEGRLLWADLEQ